jgi:hypothetical protein
VVLLLAACSSTKGSRTPAEQAYLDDLQRSSSLTSNPHPDKDIEDGRVICDVLAGIKPEQRSLSMGLLYQRQGYGFYQVHYAVKDLCPENGPPSG